MRIPTYRKRSFGQSRVTILGRDYLLGEHGLKASIGKYQRLIVEWMVAGETCGNVDQAQLTIVEFFAAYLKHCKKYYGTDASSEFHRVKQTLRALRTPYGTDPAISFRPKQLKTVHHDLMRPGERSRQYVNALCKKLTQRQFSSWQPCQGVRTF